MLGIEISTHRHIRLCLSHSKLVEWHIFLNLLWLTITEKISYVQRQVGQMSQVKTWVLKTCLCGIIISLLVLCGSSTYLIEFTSPYMVVVFEDGAFWGVTRV